MKLYEDPIALHLPRHAVTPRQVARAGELWRLFQVAAVEASARKGWPPHRFLATGAAFIVANMTVVHEREASYGETVWGRSWLRDFRRQMMARREVCVLGEEGLIARASQQWVYVDAQVRPQRAPAELVDSFAVHGGEDPPLALPAFERFEEARGPSRFALSVWHTWMDPIGHVNHPVYVDWCDEAIAQVVGAAGLDAQAVVPVAERIRFRRGAVAGDQVVVLTEAIGRTEGGATVLRHRIEDPEGQPYADATTVRRLVDGTDLAGLWASAG